MSCRIAPLLLFLGALCSVATPAMSSIFIGKPAPTFKADALMPDGTFGSVSLEDYKGKFLVLFTYPLDFTFVCPTELLAFSDRIEEFRAINAEVVAVSVDSKFSHLAWTKQPRKSGGLGKMEIPLVSDIQKTISADYGVLITEGPDAGISLRGLFIIDPKGILRQITINDLPIGRDVDETLRLLQAIDYTDKHGEVCPAGWRPGKRTMLPDPEGSLKYFNTLEDPPAKKNKH